MLKGVKNINILTILLLYGNKIINKKGMKVSYFLLYFIFFFVIF